MPDWINDIEAMVYPGRIKVPYTWWVGETGSHFFKTLQDHQRILGRRCPACEKTFVPPRRVCPICFSQSMEWTEIGTAGTLVSYTTPHYQETIHPLPRPFAYGVIKLDGADTGLTHLIAEYQPGQLRIGLRVVAVFSENPGGHIMDIKYFRPMDTTGQEST